MAYISEIKSQNEDSSASDYIEVVLEPGEPADGLGLSLYRGNGRVAESVELSDYEPTEITPQGETVYSVPLQVSEGDNGWDKSGVALYRDQPGGGSSESSVSWSFGGSDDEFGLKDFDSPNFDEMIGDFGSGGSWSFGSGSSGDTEVIAFHAVGNQTITATNGPASGLTAVGVGTSEPGDSHYWASDDYLGCWASTRGVICFTPEALVRTAAGPVQAGAIRPGDRVQTRDNGFQTVRWVGMRRLSGADLGTAPHLAPVRIPADAFGPGRPARDLTVSPQHRILVGGPALDLIAGEAEMLVPALHLSGYRGIAPQAGPASGPVTYIHLMFDRHEVIEAEGIWSESFLPGPQGLASLDPAARREFLSIFPGLGDGLAKPSAPFQAARPVLHRREAAAALSWSAVELG